MLGILSNIHGFIPEQNNKFIIWERVLHKITKYFGKLLIIFHTNNTRRTVQIFFPNISNFPDMNFYSEHYDTTTQEFLEKFTLDTKVGIMLDYHLNNPDIIALWLSFYPKLDIITLLFKNNESDGYISEVVESNIPKDNNDKSKKTLFFIFL
jgi:hypothetical protein